MYIPVSGTTMRYEIPGTYDREIDELDSLIDRFRQGVCEADLS
jgi:hypothetical protein